MLEMRQKCIKNAPKCVLFHWKKRNVQKCVRNASKMRRTPLGERLLDDNDLLSTVTRSLARVFWVAAWHRKLLSPTWRKFWGFSTCAKIWVRSLFRGGRFACWARHIRLCSQPSARSSLQDTRFDLWNQI